MSSARGMRAHKRLSSHYEIFLLNLELDIGRNPMEEEEMVGETERQKISKTRLVENPA